MFCLVMESSNLLIDVMKSIVKFIMRVLEEALKALLLYRRNYITSVSLSSNMLQLILLILSIKIIFSVCLGRAVK